MNFFYEVKVDCFFNNVAIIIPKLQTIENRY